MSRPAPQDLSERERLLLMAAYLHGPRPDQELYRVNCWRILRQAMRWAGVLDEQAEATFGQCDHPVIEEWYRLLIEMTNRTPESAVLLRGAGNLGNDKEPPAWPAYTACGVTEHGRTLAEQLLAAHPDYRPS